ncbi:hypothetical protein TQ39_06845 [Ruthenibacterium lactatiformans]|uniref:Uncharacterized protein n=1 Tax=Ruthenibacterium lactatiformans TaxID=1550024 RepID=A0A0D8J3J2_9FIRM|nr:hypothetical protein TQ39_06845 [Ruthenibacterium lactatiformans]
MCPRWRAAAAQAVPPPRAGLALPRRASLPTLTPTPAARRSTSVSLSSATASTTWTAWRTTLLKKRLKKP